MVSPTACVGVGETVKVRGAPIAGDETISWGPFSVLKSKQLFYLEEDGKLQIFSFPDVKGGSVFFEKGIGQSTQRIVRLMGHDGIMPGYLILNVEVMQWLGYEAVRVRARSELEGRLVVQLCIPDLDVWVIYLGDDLQYGLFKSEVVDRIRLRDGVR